MSQTDAERNRSAYEWFAARTGPGRVDQSKTFRWYFSPQPDGGTNMLVGIEDGRWLVCRMDSETWERFREQGDAVVHRAESRWARLRRLITRR